MRPPEPTWPWLLLGLVLLCLTAAAWPFAWLWRRARPGRSH